MKKSPGAKGGRTAKERVFLHVRQCCSQAMAELTGGSGAEWRSRVWEGIRRLHGPYARHGLEKGLSEKSRNAWIDCSPTRFGKGFEELSDEEVGQLAHAMAGFILRFHEEEGERQGEMRGRIGGEES